MRTLTLTLAALLCAAPALAQDAASEARAHFKELCSSDAAAQKRGALGLQRMGGRAAPTLVGELANDDERTRQLAGGMLKRLGAAACPALATQGLGSANETQRGTAAAVLIQIGEAARPTLEIATRNPNRAISEGARYCLEKIGGGGAAGPPPAAGASEERIEDLVTKLGDANATSRLGAALALARIGAPAVPALIEALDDEDAQRRATAALALGNMKEQAFAATDRLIAHFSDRVPQVAEACEAAVIKIGPSATSRLTAALAEIAPETRMRACNALGGLDEAGRRHLNDLAGRLNDEDKRVRRAAAFAICGLGFEGQLEAVAFLGAPETVPHFAEALGDKSATVRANAARALGLFGRTASSAVKPLLAHLGDLNPAVREACSGALAALGEAVLPDLRSATRSRNPLQRAGVAETLGRMGAAASPARAELEALTKDPAKNVREAAEAALKLVPAGGLEGVGPPPGRG